MTTPWGFPDFDAHEDLHFVTDDKCGLRAIIAVHSTHLGPAAGGVRFWHYAEGDDALTDALRLSRGMSYKNAMAGLPLGGGKSVMLANEARDKTPDMLHAFGKAVDHLGGRYVTAEDVGRARHHGASDLEIHDTVLIAAAFCMFNRYVDGLATWAPDDPDFYRARAALVAEHGYASATLQGRGK